MNTAAHAAPDANPWIIGAAMVAVAAFLAAAWNLFLRHRRGVPLIPRRPHQPVPWHGRDVLVIVLGFHALAILAGAAMGPKPAIDATLAMNTFLFASASIFAAAWLRIRGASMADLGLEPVRIGQDSALATVALALVVTPLLTLAAWLNTIVPYEHPVVELLATRRSAWTVGLVILTACITAPLAEEFFFRRIFQGWLEKVLPSEGPEAVGVAAAAFAVAHYGQGLAFLPLFPLGIVLGLLANRTGSIVPSILLHAMFNAVSVGLLLAGAA